MKQHTFDVKKLSSELRKKIASLHDDVSAEEYGIVHRIGDGVAWVSGLWAVGFHESVTIECRDGSQAAGFVLSLLEDEIGIVLLDGDSKVAAGDTVKRTNKTLSVPVGLSLIGRVVDPLGRPLDGKGPIKTTVSAPVERPAPQIIDRQRVHEPLLTGITAIDTMVPIGRGQRELIIGDRQTGKTAIAIDTILHQVRSGSDIISIYCAIGQKQSTVARLIERLGRENAMERSIIVTTSAADPAPLQYIAPYAACTIGEWFRDNQRHALVVYDDLSKHASAYRQLALLLRRPPGREAYPGDIFYLHARLLERAAKLSQEKGSGSLTALPIIETQAGDVSAYIPTNVISITDGQIFLESDLFYQGIRPAISVGLSVSRVGSAAQPNSIKSVAKSLRLDLAQYRELAAFAQFGNDVDSDTVSRLKRGQLLTELLKQPQYSPFATWQQVAMLVLAQQGTIDSLPLHVLPEFLDHLFEEITRRHQPLIHTLETTKDIDEVLKNSLITVGKHVADRYIPKEQPLQDNTLGHVI